MKRTVLLGVAAGLAFAACPEPARAPCERIVCARGETCDPATGGCVGEPPAEDGGAQPGSDAGEDAGAALPLEGYCTALAQARCARAQTCGRLATEQLDACLQHEGTLCDLWLHKADAGVRGYDSTAALRCLDAARAASCNDARGPDPVCEDAFPPSSPPGGRCDQSTDCAAGVCVASTGPCAACVAWRDAGEVCTEQFPCAPGLGCSAGLEDGGTTDGGRRACQVYASPGPPGSPCGPFQPCEAASGFCLATPPDGGAPRCEAWPSAGERCNGSDDRCLGGFCNSAPGDGGLARCEPLRDDGTSCVGGYQCAAGLCTSGHLLDGGSRTCGALDAGLPCAALGDCGAQAFCRGLARPAGGPLAPGVCSPRIPLGGACTEQELDDGCASRAASCLDGQCRMPRLELPAGAQCDRPGQCQPGLFCPDAGTPTANATCSAQRGPGSACAADDWCLEGLVCHPLRRSCVQLPGAGGDCSDTACRDFLACLEPDGGSPRGVCFPFGAPLSPCGTTAPCAQGSFCALDAGVCLPQRAGGAACSASFECGSGVCTGADGGAAAGVCVEACFP